MSKKIKLANVLIVDSSSSMCNNNKHLGVKEGLHSSLMDIRKEIKADDGEHSYRNIILFFSYSNQIKTILDSKKVKKQTIKDVVDAYQPKGMTALYDTIGKANELLLAENYHGASISIFTDGLENNSCKYTAESVKEIITTWRANDWDVQYFGTTEQELSRAQQIGIQKRNRYASNLEGSRSSFKVSSVNRLQYMKMKKAAQKKDD